MARQISEGRKTAFYMGTTIMVAGGLMFASCFLLAILGMGRRSHITTRMDFDVLLPLLAFGGMALLIVGGIIRGIGARGLAGSGVVLDPEKARQELEPFARMGGGLVKDALDEADIHIGGTAPQKVVMVKCGSCGKLNEEDSKFCQECGKPL
jgi:hypothetical protein